MEEWTSDVRRDTLVLPSSAAVLNSNRTASVLLCQLSESVVSWSRNGTDRSQVPPQCSVRECVPPHRAVSSGEEVSFLFSTRRVRGVKIFLGSFSHLSAHLPVWTELLKKEGSAIRTRENVKFRLGDASDQ